jgi:hypothetical protein
VEPVEGGADADEPDAPAPAPAGNANATTTPMMAGPSPAAPAPAPAGNGTADETAAAPTTVDLAMAMTVDDPAAFVADEASGPAVEAGIATATGVEASAVTATLSVGSRRLGGRRAQAGTVDVAATIQAADAAAAAALQDTAAAVTAEAMATALNDALMDLNVTVTVTSLSAELGEAGNAAPSPSSPERGDSSASMLVASKLVFGLVALLAFFSF